MRGNPSTGGTRCASRKRMWLAFEESLKSDSQDQFAVASLSAPLAAREGVEGGCRGEFNHFRRFLEPVGTPATLWHSKLIFW